MVGFQLKVLGVQALLQKLKPSTVKEPVNEGVKKLAKYILSVLKPSTPVLDSRLRPSMTAQVYGFTAKIGTNVEYAQFVEYGTKHMKARHVIRGGSARILGKGPFTYTMEQVQGKIKDFLNDIGKAIEVKFG